MVDLDQMMAQLQPTVGPVKPHFLSVYTEERCYGGPEEGGWWYDRLHHEGSREFPSEEEAQRARESLVAWLAGENAKGDRRRAERTASIPDGPDPYLDTEGYIPRGWSDGGKYVLIVEEHAGESQSTGAAPTYE